MRARDRYIVVMVVYVCVESSVVEESVCVETREQFNAALGDMWTVLVIYSVAEKVNESRSPVLGPHTPDQ